MIRIFLLMFLGSIFMACASSTYEQVSEYMQKNYLQKPLDKGVKIDKKALHVKGDYAFLSAPPSLEDKSNPYEYFADMSYALCLKKQEGKWSVLYDLSRSDVPSKAELKSIKKQFPKEFPQELLPEFWQKKLK